MQPSIPVSVWLGAGALHVVLVYADLVSAMSLADKLAPGRPKRLLALDGGGIRGMITIEILAEIEKTLARALGAAHFRLCDFFDYIAGTSTGAIIATCLSLGMSVDEIRDFYVASGRDMFDKASILRRFRYKFDDDKLAAKLRSILRKYTRDGNDPTVGSDALKTLLLVVLRNATTDSPWPISNNPRAKYNDQQRADSNLQLPLWQVVRASTAAPTYFPPESITVGANDFLFVDGGVTMYNNPAFLLFLMATLEPYNLTWPVGQENLLLVSVGTGAAADANANLQPGDMNLLYNAGSVPSALMYAAMNEQDMLCRVFGRCLHGGALDREVGDLRWAPGKTYALPKLFSYVRYTADLSRAGLDALGLRDVEPPQVQALDSIAFIDQLQRVGRAAGQEVRREHFSTESIDPDPP
jgi:uncharacterized protein